jgi:Immunity protein 10
VTEFNAAAVGAEEMTDNNCYVLVLAEQSDGTGQRLEFQMARSYEQDKTFGMDTYCLCTETGACHYGGVTSWTLIEDQAVLIVTLNKAASKVLDVVGGFRIKVPHRDLPIVRESLHRILAA